MANQAFSLLTCPNDILFLILEYCEQSSLYQLSLINKTLSQRCIPHLYREVDLSSHNLGRIVENENKFRIEEWANVNDDNRPPRLLSRQRSFLKTMTENPQYAMYILSFSWTLIWYDQYKERGLTEIEFQLWNVFSQLQRVQKLDLASLPQDKPLEAYTRQVPPNLFPRVTELKLAGWMSHKLVTSLFHSIHLSKLHVLILDALQEEGKLPDGSPMPEDLNIQHWSSRWRATLCEADAKDISLTDSGIIFPGPMWLAFMPLVGKFESLRRLEIRIPPLEDARDPTCPDHERYISVMADLIVSVSPTLETLIIDYARRQRAGKASPFIPAYEIGLQNLRLSYSEKLLKAMLHSFRLNDQWKWELLRIVSFKGFLQSAAVNGPFDEGEVQVIRSKIEDLLSTSKLSLEWSNDSPCPAFLFLGHDHGISEFAMEQFSRKFQQIEQALSEPSH